MSLSNQRPELPKALHICIVAKRFPILGGAIDHGFLWPIARLLTLRGHRVTIISWKTPQGNSEIQLDSIHAYFLGEGTRKTRLEFASLVQKKILELHKQDPIHIVHSLDEGGVLIARYKKQMRLGYIFDVEATQMPQLFSLLGLSQDDIWSQIRTHIRVIFRFLTSYLTRDRELLNRADGVFVTTPEQKLALERYYLYPDARTYSVPYGIEVSDLSPREKSDELRKKLNIPANSHVVVTMTDMTELAEMQNLLRAFERVVVKKGNCRLIVVGEGPLQKEIEFEMLNLALGGKVVFAGSVGSVKLPDYIALADVYLSLGSKTSGFEPTVLEAMAQKKLVIGSEVSPLSAIISDGIDGFLVRPADQKTITQTLLQVFEGEIPVAQIGENARTKVLNLFDTKKMVDLTLSAYYKTLLSTGFYSRNINHLTHIVDQPLP